jgi:hypothetical protein
LHDLFDGVPQADARAAQLSFAEIVASCLEVVILGLTIFEGELPGSALACEVMAVGMLTPPSVGTGVRHLIGEVSVMAGHAAPSGSVSRAKMMGRFAMGGDMIEPGAIGTVAAFLVLVLRQFIVLHILAVPRDGAAGPSP